MNTKLAHNTARRVQCDAPGSCVVFANELAKVASDFTVVEGAVKFRGSIPFNHVWIEDNGKRFDPTLAQFNFFDLSSVEYLPEQIYTPKAFARSIKKHSDYANFSRLLI